MNFIIFRCSRPKAVRLNITLKNKNLLYMHVEYVLCDKISLNLKCDSFKVKFYI